MFFAKHAFTRARTVARDARLPVSVTRSRNQLVAVWRRESVSGRLELEWQPVGATAVPPARVTRKAAA